MLRGILSSLMMLAILLLKPSLYKKSSMQVESYSFRYIKVFSFCSLMNVDVVFGLLLLENWFAFSSISPLSSMMCVYLHSEYISCGRSNHSCNSLILTADPFQGRYTDMGRSGSAPTECNALFTSVSI